MNKLLGLLLLSTTAFAAPITVTTEQNLGSLQYRNFVINPGAERNVTRGITDSGGIATRTTTTPIEGVAEFTIDATSSGQQVDWALNTQDQGLKNSNCEARWVIEGDASLYKAQVLSGSNIAAELSPLLNYSSPQIVALNVPCGDLSTTYKLRIESTSASAAAILVDSVYYGRATNLSSGNGIGDWTSYTLTIGGTTTAPTLGTTTVNQARWRRIGDSMEIQYQFRMSTDGTDGSGSYLFPIPSGYAIDTTKLTASTSPTTTGISTSSVGVAAGSVSDTTASPGYMGVYNSTNLVMQVASGTVGSSILRLGTGGSPRQFSFSVVVPILGWASQGAYSPNTVNQQGSTTWVGGASKAFSNTNTTWTTNTSANFATRTNTGVAIDPSSTNDLAFKVSQLPAGSYYVYFTGQIYSSGGGNCSASIYDGSSNLFVSAGPSVPSFGGIVNYTTQADHTFTIQTRTTSGTCFTEFDTTTYEGAQMGIIPVSSGVNAPLLVGSVTSNSIGTERIERAIVTNNGSACTASSQTGSWISSITRSGTGLCDITVASGIFSAEPTCHVTARLLDGRTGTTPRNGQTNSATSVKVATFNGNTAVYNDADFNIICMGPR